MDGNEHYNLGMEVVLGLNFMQEHEIGRCLIGGAETKDHPMTMFTLRICAE